MSSKELKVSEEARTKAHSSAEAVARQADKLTQKLANMPKVGLCLLVSQSVSQQACFGSKPLLTKVRLCLRLCLSDTQSVSQQG